MAGKGRAPSKETAPSAVAPARNGLGPMRVIEIQRARILAAMVEVSAERGAGNVTVAHIVERAGVSRRTFYELFSDHDDCFLAAFDEAVARATRYVLDTYEPAAKWAERMRTSLAALLSFLDAERSTGQFMVVGSLGAGASAMERRRHVIAQVVAVIDEGREESKSVELPSLTAEGIAGGVLSVLHSRLLAPASPGRGATGVDEGQGGSLLQLTGPLMSMIVLPYLGQAAARRELKRRTPVPAPPRISNAADPLRDVEMRLTYRTVRVLTAVAALSRQDTYPSNREVGLAAGIHDQGQISKLLTRLSKLGLIENTGAGLARGVPNAWMLTSKGQEIEAVVGRAG